MATGLAFYSSASHMRSDGIQLPRSVMPTRGLSGQKPDQDATREHSCVVQLSGGEVNVSCLWAVFGSPALIDVLGREGAFS